MSLPNILFLWDFDNTLVLNDSDRLAVETLGPDVLTSHLHNRDLVRKLGWTQVMNDAFSELVSRGHRPEAIIQAGGNTLLPPPTLNAVREIADCPCAHSAILSDSNSAFIDSCLARHGASAYFSAGVFTNSANVDESRLVIHPYTQNDPHDCPTCPPNLCKGVVCRRLLHLHSPHSRFVYVGDGSNDFCAARLLGPRDVVLYRAGFSLEKKLQAGVPATITPWNSPEELHTLVSQLLPTD